MPTVIDTVVAHYFLLVQEFELLLDLLDGPAIVSRIVYDPEDHPGQPESTVSEITRNIRYEQRLARHPGSPRVGQEPKANTRHLSVIRVHVERGDVEVVDMTQGDLTTFSRLAAHDPDPALKLVLPLGAGEAAFVAIAIQGDYVLATDDVDRAD